MDVTQLRDFYARPLGLVVRRLLAYRLRARWRHVKGLTLVGLGFASPFMGIFRQEAEAVCAFMPAAQGGTIWPPDGGVCSVLVEDTGLPLADACVDRLLAVHCMEFTEGARPLLREIWRVLKPEGRLIIVVPNRSSIWARIDTTPFGHGRPYSRGQIAQLLSEAMFTPVGWSVALHMPPTERAMMLRWATGFERLGATALPALAGVIIVESQKELVAPIGRRVRVRGLRDMVAAPGSQLRRQAPDQSRC